MKNTLHEYNRKGKLQVEKVDFSCDLKVLTDLQLDRFKGSEFQNLAEATVKDLSPYDLVEQLVTDK